MRTSGSHPQRPTNTDDTGGLLLEVIACSVADAIEAARGGADRLEVAIAMDRHGLTPPIELVGEIQRAVGLPLRVMVREHDDFRRDRPGELDRLCAAAAQLDALGVDGIVLGFERDGAVDEQALKAVLSAAPRTRATFHRAFDALADPIAALGILKRYPQIDHVLSAGGEGTWPERAGRLAAVLAHAQPEITILPGSGVDAAAIEILFRAGLTEAHVGGAARVPVHAIAPVSADAVRELRRRIPSSA